ncbi:uncharacterized protein LOC119361202 isoform X1 [Triticum dicoccoides]|uniref:uncharacterized protein LOC119361202 isoform X1 n=1 Tax=Triticum dicoccoides TaxID=85692 RepID=UPI00188E8F49|nr:uncharacterized protein LOC119361202 isoform X1 [Triticum dicoccoides]XP_037482430.1 uncharacterized protein LOC119361202 isoform X1 [Triticum dicoccoides]XP_037482434.1 uncharacterized protein LOC119361202 isoform X1 [Triticum dicoccoides]
MSVVYMFQFKILKKQLNFPRESSTCKDSYTKGSLYTKTSRMIRAEDLDLIVRLDVSKYDKESTERGTCMNRTEELLYAIKDDLQALRQKFLFEIVTCKDNEIQLPLVTSFLQRHGLINTVTFKGSALQDSTQRNTSMGKMFPYR